MRPHTVNLSNHEQSIVIRALHQRKHELETIYLKLCQMDVEFPRVEGILSEIEETKALIHLFKHELKQ